MTRDSGLAALVRDELVRPAPASAQAFAEELRRRHGASLAGVLFYGSCLRRGSDEGVLDFYALVDDYRGAYRSHALRLANAALPPNVFYLELPRGDTRLRAKYAVFSLRDFARAVQLTSLRTGTWARFCQPTVCAHARDDAALAALVDSLCAAVESAVLIPLFVLSTFAFFR